jgi:nitrogen regulatory protein PII 2
MKEVIAIIRPRKMGATRVALEELGFPSQTALGVLGRGKQRGLAGEVDVEIPPEVLERGRTGGMKYVPKRLLTLVVHDGDVETVVRAIVKVNQSGQIGDGKIFVSPIDDALRVRTRETGGNALV